MTRYVLKKLFAIIPTLLVVVFIVFFLMNLTPGSPAMTILGQDATPEQIEQLNHELGYDVPFIFRYFRYLIQLIQGNMGRSYVTNRPVFTEVLVRFPTTAVLAVYSMAIGVAISLPIGVVSAVKQYSILDTAGVVTAMFFACIPAFWLGLMLILIFALKLRLLPSYGAGTIIHFILPAFTQAIPQSARTMRLTRTSMLEVIRQDYIRMARSKGQIETKVVISHALTNALLPVITMIGVDFGFILGGAIVVERVFSINGVGMLILDSINHKDVPMVTGCAVIFCICYMLVLLLVDILYAFIDPRIRARYRGKKN
ncbi:MAG: ABC transporter permease [Fusobacteriaceae bacterium]|jgi:peptide/nickel transport system permease protein|nr:ABC transporter permease [Fusobacteriaceae bacterium]